MPLWGRECIRRGFWWGNLREKENLGERMYAKKVLVGKPERKGKLGGEGLFEEGFGGKT